MEYDINGSYLKFQIKKEMLKRGNLYKNVTGHMYLIGFD